MKINRYRAKNLKTAIDKARTDLGPEAKVIHVRQLDKGSDPDDQSQNGAESTIEIIAAIDDESYAETGISGITTRQHGVEAYATQMVKTAETKITSRQDSDDFVSPQVYAKPKTGNDHILQVLQECCAKNQVDQSITYEILSLLNDSGKHDTVRGEDSILSHRKQKPQSAEAKPFSHWLPKAPRDYLSLFMDKQIRVSGGLDMSRKTAIFIGPTGVGKTTTLAKLAAQSRFQYRRSVGLITIDAYRIAAIDQLRTYAQIMSIPLKVALTPEELGQCIRDYKNMDVILVDTPGRSPFNTDALHSLQDFLKAAQPADTHLLISLSMKESDAYLVTESFAPRYVRQIIFTKIDETSSFGPILGVCKRTEKPISYLTNGQNVPDDIETAQTERMVDLFLGA